MFYRTSRNPHPFAFFPLPMFGFNIFYPFILFKIIHVVIIPNNQLSLRVVPRPSLWIYMSLRISLSSPLWGEDRVRGRVIARSLTTRQSLLSLEIQHSDDGSRKTENGLETAFLLPNSFIVLLLLDSRC